MATLGTCGYCAKPAGTTCQMCGTPVCEEHKDDDNPSVCNACARGTTMGPTNR